MKIKILFILVFSFLFFGFEIVHADILINEVQINPSGASFVEIYNSGDTSQDLTGWSIKRKTASGTEYPFVSVSRLKDKIISANSYFLLANENSYTGSIVPDATWATSYNLASNNSISLYDNTNVNPISKVGWGSTNDCDIACPLNPADGQSIQRSSNGWIIATPTPKAQNASSLNSGDLGNSNSTNINTNNGGSGGSVIVSVPADVKPKVVEIPKIKTKITANVLAYVGIPFDLQASTIGFSNEIRNYGKYFWNFGDGDSKEINVSQNQKFSHTYYYEGDYDIRLEYYSNLYQDTPDTVNTFEVKVIPATVIISKVGDAKDFFIELSNDSLYDIDISNWKITSFTKNFVLPKNTTIGTKSKITLSPKITNFAIFDKDSLKLLKSTSEVAYEYNSTPINVNNIVPSKETVAKNISTTNDITQSTSPGGNDISKEIKGGSTPIISSYDSNLPNNTEIKGTSFGATPVLSDEKNNNENKSYFFFWGFVVLLLVSCGAVYYIRGRKNVQEVGGDFKIIDE